VGAKDPLYDDSIKMMDLMAKAGINCYCQVYDNLPHGFLNLDFAITECEKTIDDSIIHLKKLLS
jgi:acetyl esterase/lipase